MCMSFTDVGVSRQEAIWVQTVALAQDDYDDRYWARRAEEYASYMTTVVYPLMDRLSLEAHLLTIRDEAVWVPVFDAITAELASRPAESIIETVDDSVTVTA